MRDEHLGSGATWARMIDGHGAARVSTAPRLMFELVRLKPDLITICAAALVFWPLTDDSTIGRRASHVDLQDAAIFQREIQNLTVLSVWR